MAGPYKIETDLQEEGHSSFEPCPSVMLQWRTAELLDKDCRQFAQVFIAYLLRGFCHPQVRVPLGAQDIPGFLGSGHLGAVEVK